MCIRDRGIQNSCNPVFIEIGLRLGTDDFYKYFGQFGLMGETGVDLPGEASTMMHKKENVGQVELATMSSVSYTHLDVYKRQVY